MTPCGCARTRTNSSCISISSEAASDQRGLGVSKAAWGQHGLGEAASLMRDRNWLRVRVRSIPGATGSAWFLDLRVHLQSVWESSNFTPSSVPLYRILEKQGTLVHRCAETEKLDSFAIDFAFQGF